jgi:Ran GTPase-activating protein (RanGAP) involved in mRNA processing and transport
VGQLVEGLKLNSSLTVLQVGASRLATHTHSSLTVLQVGGNGAGADGAALLADALSGNEWSDALTELDFSRNGLSQSGAAVLADALPANRFLKTLGLQANGLGDGGAALLLAAGGSVIVQLDCLSPRCCWRQVGVL